MLFEKVPTPCVGVCSTTFGDVVCRGCRRYLHEVIDWNRYSDAEKRLIWQRLDAVMEQVLSGSFRIDDPARLRALLAEHAIPHREGASPWSHLAALLRAGARQLPDLAECGVTRLDRSELTLVQLREKLNGDMHALACAYYEKDFLRAAGIPPVLPETS
ncbi:MAG TPA: DUF1289 domain-containing protein [Moraxellaceae bacterium]|nr:DUF1289 domain-containing protein [Moraxellaceae bacterium]